LPLIFHRRSDECPIWESKTIILGFPAQPVRQPEAFRRDRQDGTTGDSAGHTTEPVRIETSRVLLVIYNPVMEAASGTKIIQSMNWNNPDDLSNTFIQDIWKSAAEWHVSRLSIEWSSMNFRVNRWVPLRCPVVYGRNQ